MQQIQKNARFFDFPPDFSCKSAFFSVLYRHNNMKGYIMNILDLQNELLKDKKSLLCQNILDNDKNFVQSDNYLVIEPGLTDKNSEQVITHKELLETMISTNSETPLDCFTVLPFSEIA